MANTNTNLPLFIVWLYIQDVGSLGDASAGLISLVEKKYYWESYECVLKEFFRNRNIE